MRRSLLCLLAVAGAAVVLLGQSPAGPESRPVGIDRRILWTTSNVKGSPEPPDPYRAAPAFPKLKFFEPLDLTFVPGKNRLAVATRPGKLFTFVNDPQTAGADLLLDVKKTVYALAFHPRFADNGYLFVTYIAEDGKPNGTRVARYEVRGDPPRADPRSEKVILEWPAGGHNAGCLQFGPDGCLYIGTGDGSGIADELQTGQDVGDLLASILRIDVDHPGDGRPYSIPEDNPFVGRKGARPEVWAYGLRQPWKFSFDRATGELWCGDVGQDLWEMVYRIRKGGNYGWSVMEGAHEFRPERKRGPTAILGPLVEHPHSDFRSITGGYVYHGKRLGGLAGAYVYGDFDTGRIRALRLDGDKVAWQRELTKVPQRVVSFGTDEAGELYHLDWVGGQVHRLVPAPKATEGPPFPRKLSETGLFASTKDHTPAPGLVPYSVNAPLWSDGAAKERFLAIPGDGKIRFDAIDYPQPAPGAPRGWKFPDGTVLVKTFSLDTVKGDPKSRRRLETRLLHFQQLGGSEEVGDQYWRGYTYVWDDDQADATLLGPAGLDRVYTITDGDAPGGTRRQTWHFPSRAECTLCHTMPAKYALGVNTLQLNRDHDYGAGRIANQLRTWEHLGLFADPLPKPPEKLPRLADYTDARLDLARRARAYLHANCSHCHMKWGGGNAEFQLLVTLPVKDTGTVGTRPAHGTFGLDDPRVIAPGDPTRSMVLHRMKLLGLGRMPHIASSVVDEQAVRLIHDWIAQGAKE